MDIKRRSASYSSPRRSHAPSASFTSSFKLNPLVTGLEAFMDVKDTFTFDQKMAFFQRKGSRSLIPSEQPMWREDSSRGYSARFRLLLRRLRCGRSILLSLVFLSLVVTFWVVTRLSLRDRVKGSLRLASQSRILHCEPYSAYGTLVIDEVDPDGTSWRPFDKKCQAPGFFRSLRHGKLDGMDWVRGRTVLLIGDTIDREHVEQFCMLMGQEAEVVTDSHPLSTTAVQLKRKRSRASKNRDMTEGSLPRICHIASLNLTLASVYHYGLDQDDFWSRSPVYRGPGLFERRLSDHFQPFIRKLQGTGRNAPDLVELNSGAYDLMRWARRDIEVSRATTDALSHEQLDWFRLRVIKAMDAVQKAFPTSAHLWRSIHYPSDAAAEVEYYEERSVAQSQTTPTQFSLNRVSQVDQTVRSLVSTPGSGYWLNAWGTMMLGHATHQKDALHGNPGAPATVIWAEIMLFELFRAVSSTPA